MPETERAGDGVAADFLLRETDAGHEGRWCPRPTPKAAPKTPMVQGSYQGSHPENTENVLIQSARGLPAQYQAPGLAKLRKSP